MITYFESTDQQVVAFEMGNGDAIYLVNLGNETVKDIQVDFDGQPCVLPRVAILSKGFEANRV